MDIDEAFEEMDIYSIKADEFDGTEPTELEVRGGSLKQGKRTAHLHRETADDTLNWVKTEIPEGRTQISFTDLMITAFILQELQDRGFNIETEMAAFNIIPDVLE